MSTRSDPGSAKIDVAPVLALSPRHYTGTTTVAKDVAIVNSVQRGLNSRGCEPGSLVIDPSFGVNNAHSVRTLKEWLIDAIEL